MKINELRLGEQIKARWLLKTIDVRKTNTRPQKDFLAVTLTDGQDDVKGMRWNYIAVGDLIPVGKCVNITATVGEYNDVLQLTITRIELADNQDTSDFLPDLGYDKEALYTVAMAMISHIQNPIVKAIITDIYVNSRQELITAPAAKGMHHAGMGGLLKHQIEVCETALGICSSYSGLKIDQDLIIAGSLLHDIGKLKTYQYVDCLIEMTDMGMMMEHITIGINLLETYNNGTTTEGPVRLLQHIIASHHGKVEFGSPVTPKFVEAYIINYADMISVMYDVLKTGNAKAKPNSNYTDKLYILSNYPHMTQAYVQKLLATETVCGTPEVLED